MEHWHNQDSDSICKSFEVESSSGLTQEQVLYRQAKFGKNSLPEPKRKSLIVLFFNQFLSPLIYLLIVAAIIAFLLGETKDALVIVFVLLLNAIVGSIQEGRAEQSMDSLRKLSQIKSRVRRQSQDLEILAEELVPGDIIKIAAGDIVPSDARLIEASNLSIAEAPLTGESVPVSKITKVLLPETALADRQNMIYGGTHVTSGRGLAVVTTIGLQNEIGKIATLASQTTIQKTQLELRVEKFGKVIALVSVVLFFLVIAIGFARGISFAEIFMIAVSQMVSLVPEGLPVALTIALAVGVQRMAKQKTIVRKLPAVETLGSINYICTDKTGTLTKNEMTVKKIYLGDLDQYIDIPGSGYDPTPKLKIVSEMQNLIEACVLCNDAHLRAPVDKSNEWKVLGDPTEGALLTLAQKYQIDFEDIQKKYPRQGELPFDSETKMMATQHEINGKVIVYIKGAPESVFNLIEDQIENSIDLFKKKYFEAAKVMADSALRVLCIARVEGVPIQSSEGYLAFKNNKNKIHILGLVGQIDPPREEVKSAIQDCLNAGIKPVMVTGDHKSTGLAIAKTLGIISAEDLNSQVAVDGQELDQWTSEDWNSKIENVSVFARVHPSQKLKIVEALQKKNNVVAMTGDGVNDAPALIKADVGVAMGITGTEVAKEASKIIITDDNFLTITKAVAEGRLVYQNIKKLILFLFVTSIDEVVLLLLCLIFGFPPPLAAVQILWINLVSEGALTINLIMDPPEGDEMSKPPIDSKEPLLDKFLLKRMPLMIIVSVATTFGWFYYRTRSGVPATQVQSETFTVLVVNQWFNVLNCRSSWQSVFQMNLFKNPWLVGGLFLANAMHILVIYWRPLGDLFHTTPIDLDHFFIIGAISSLVLWVEELRKYFLRTQAKF